MTRPTGHVAEAGRSESGSGNAVKGMVPVILCGGSGTRLWPRSRAARPKPFLPLVGSRTLFEATLDRCAAPATFAPPMIVTGQAHVSHVRAQIDGQSQASLLVEPLARGTAVAVALAALRLPEDAIMLVCPSDHHIADTAAFHSAVDAAARLAEQGWLVSLAITPNAPETGFGYLKRGEPLGEAGYRTLSFVEKPDARRAREYLVSGEYAWNGGIFAFRAGTFLEELKLYRPAMEQAVREAVAGGRTDGTIFYPDAAAFTPIAGESVDYAVMEHTARKAMVPVECGWSDIGAWDALHDALPQDHAGNSARGPAELLDCRKVLVDTDGPRVSAIGLEDVIIVVDGEDVLVTSRSGAQKVGKLNGAAMQ